MQNQKINKILKVLLSLLQSADIYCSSDPFQKDKCGSVRNDRLQHFWISLMCISAIGFLIKVTCSIIVLVGLSENEIMK